MAWRAINPRLGVLDYPDDGVEVIVFCEGDVFGDMQIASCETDVDGTSWFDSRGATITNVTHWTPRPIPPHRFKES